MSSSKVQNSEGDAFRSALLLEHFWGVIGQIEQHDSFLQVGLVGGLVPVDFFAAPNLRGPPLCGHALKERIVNPTIELIDVHGMNAGLEPIVFDAETRAIGRLGNSYEWLVLDSIENAGVLGIGIKIHSVKAAQIESRVILQRHFSAVVNAIRNKQQPNVRARRAAIPRQLLRFLFNCVIEDRFRIPIYKAYTIVHGKPICAKSLRNVRAKPVTGINHEMMRDWLALKTFGHKCGQDCCHVRRAHVADKLNP